MQIDWFPLWLSLRVALLAAFFSLALGLWLAYFLANRNFWGKELLDAFATLPLVLPPTVLGYYLLVALGRESAFGRAYEAIFGHPLVFTWQAAVESVDRVYEKAARNLGASEWRVFWRVTLPLARRSIFAATVLAFARSLGDFGATLMVAGNIPHQTQTAAVAIYDAVESGNTMLARVLVLVISTVAILI